MLVPEFILPIVIFGAGALYSGNAREHWGFTAILVATMSVTYWLTLTWLSALLIPPPVLLGAYFAGRTMPQFFGKSTQKH